MLMPTDDRLMKISELAATTGVSKQTVHFYLREGLLSPPVQASKNMAYYDRKHIEEIRLIKELQEQRYLPLAVIKLILEARRTGNDLDKPDHLEMFEQVFTEARDERWERCRTISELLDETGLSEEAVKEMESIGLLTPELMAEGKRFDSYDAAMAQAMGRLLDLGLEIHDLTIYSQLLNLARTEVQLIHDKIFHRPGNSTHPPLKDINSALMYARSLLAAKAKREFLIKHPHSEEDVKGGDLSC